MGVVLLVLLKNGCKIKSSCVMTALGSFMKTADESRQLINEECFWDFFAKRGSMEPPGTRLDPPLLLLC